MTQSHALEQLVQWRREKIKKEYSKNVNSKTVHWLLYNISYYAAIYLEP